METFYNLDWTRLSLDSGPNDSSDTPETPVRIVGKHLSGLREALKWHIYGAICRICLKKEGLIIYEENKA